MELVLGRDRVENLRRPDTYAATCSEHYPVELILHMRVESASRTRRIIKTLLQSRRLAEKANMYYEVALRPTDELLEGVNLGTADEDQQNAEIAFK